MPRTRVNRHNRRSRRRNILGAVILGGEFPDFPDEDPGAEPKDPFDGKGVDGAVDEAGAAALDSIPGVSPTNGAPLSPEIQTSIKDAAPPAIDAAIKGVPTTPDGTMGQSIQQGISDEITEKPEEFHDKALSQAIQDVGGDPAKLTDDAVTKAYDDQAKQLATEKTAQYKQGFGDTVKDAVDGVSGGDTDFDSDRPYKDGERITDQMVDDPSGTQEKLQADADDIEKENPDWKDRVKEAAGYGAKGLLILALIGAFLPGGSNIVDKLAKMAGDVVAKLVKVAANILKAFLGPLITAFWDFVKKLKGPLIVIGIIIAILLALWVYRQVRGSG
jgi:hypothetical protein